MYKKFSFLRNVVKILVAGLVAITMFASCEKEEEKPPKTIVVTGIPVIYEGKVGVLTADKGGTTQAMAMANINGTSVSFRMQDFQSKEVWTKDGTYDFILLIYENSQAMSDKKTLWDGYLYTWKIAEETTTIAWNEFICILPD